MVVSLLASASPLSDEQALSLADAPAHEVAALCAAAARVRDAGFGRVVTFSPKVFLPLTNVCRNRCEYCSFRRSPDDEGAWTMRPDEVRDGLLRASRAGCAEALFCLGDKPETAFAAYRQTLATLGQASTVEYLHFAGRMALELGLLPHTNAGLLSADEMLRLKEVNVSLGLMLESASERLCEPGMPHHRAPDKRPAKRLAMIATAGELRIPFTTGILVGIGETRRERIESLLAIRALHRAHGHIQEVIVQNFRAVAGVGLASTPEPDEVEVTHAVAMARLILDPEVSLQAPPNLNPAGIRALLDAGINDLGGISPVTPDYINPKHPWPHLNGLYDACRDAGFSLRPRLPIYDCFVERPGYVHASLRDAITVAARRIASVDHPAQLGDGARAEPVRGSRREGARAE